MNDNFKLIKCCCCEAETYLKFNFKFLGFFFVMFYFIGIFQLLWIINSTKEELGFAVKSLLFRKNRTHYYPKDFNFIKNYENNIFMNLPDFNLFYISSILGNAILKCCDFRISLFVFMCINTGSIFVIRIIKVPDSYDFSQLMIIFSFFLLFFVSIGSITLFGQQIFFDGLNKYYSFINEKKIIILFISFFIYGLLKFQLML